jgi:hypothetical protein
VSSRHIVGWVQTEWSVSINTIPASPNGNVALP